MADSLLLTCPDHAVALAPDTGDPGRLFCPMGNCPNEVRIGAADGFPFSPFTELQQTAVAQHEFVRSREAAGFSRSEAMQILCCMISAGIMKDRGNG